MKKLMCFLSVMLLLLSCSNGSSNVKNHENTQTQESLKPETAEYVHSQLDELLLGSWYLSENGEVDPIWGPSYVFKSNGEVAYNYETMSYDANGNYTLSDKRLVLKMIDCYGANLVEHYEIISITSEKLVVADLDNNRDNIVFVKYEF